MTPVLVRIGGKGDGLLIGFSEVAGRPIGIIVWPGGQLDWAEILEIRIERPNTDYPVGHGPWSRVDAETVPV